MYIGLVTFSLPFYRPIRCVNNFNVVQLLSTHDANIIACTCGTVISGWWRAAKLTSNFMSLRCAVVERDDVIEQRAMSTNHGRRLTALPRPLVCCDENFTLSLEG